MTDQMLDIAPGAIVVVGDERWLVSSVDHTADGELLTVRRVSELAEGATAQIHLGEGAEALYGFIWDLETDHDDAGDNQL